MRPNPAGFILLLLVAIQSGCSTDVDLPTPPLSAEILYVNGATYPVLAPGQAILIEGVSFGDALGEVRFPTSAGGAVVAPVRSDAWSDRFIATAVPEDAASGVIQVVPNTGDPLELGYAVIPRQLVPTVTWAEQAPLPFPDSGLGVALAQDLTSGILQTYLMATVRPPGADSTAIYAGFTGHTGITGWELRSMLPGRHSGATLIITTPHTARSPTPRLYILGGVDSAGAASSAILTSSITLPNADLGPLDRAPPLPRALVRPRVVLALGMLYVTGGIDREGVPNREVFIGRIRPDGVLEGWFTGPSLPDTRAFHGTLVAGSTITAFGGADTVTSQPGIDTLTPLNATGVRAALSARSGFFASPTWSAPDVVLPSGRSRFALLTFDGTTLVVGGVYAGARSGAEETLAAPIGDGVLGGFSRLTTTNTIAELGGGNLVDAIGVTWYDLNGVPHGAVLGGRALPNGSVRRDVWGF